MFRAYGGDWRRDESRVRPFVTSSVDVVSAPNEGADALVAQVEAAPEQHGDVDRKEDAVRGTR
jgi:hypothetical protein